MDISVLFRKLPDFKGKFRLAAFLLQSRLFKNMPVVFCGKNEIQYAVPNTIDAIGRELFINGVFEKATIEVLTRLLKKGSVFFDVGANIGAILMPVAMKTGAVVHAFEPTAEVFNYLRRNVNDNHLNNITLNNLAVHSKDEMMLKFFPVSEKFGHSSFAQTFADQPHYLVKTVSIDAYCKRNNIIKIHVLKVDVQGFETEVLQGCNNLLSRHNIDNIIFEFEEWADDVTQTEKGSSQIYLKSFGYKIYTMDNIELKETVTSGSCMLWAKSPVYA